MIVVIVYYIVYNTVNSLSKPLQSAGYCWWGLTFKSASWMESIITRYWSTSWIKLSKYSHAQWQGILINPDFPFKCTSSSWEWIHWLDAWRFSSLADWHIDLIYRRSDDDKVFWGWRATLAFVSLAKDKPSEVLTLCSTLASVRFELQWRLFCSVSQAMDWHFLCQLLSSLHRLRSQSL